MDQRIRCPGGLAEYLVVDQVRSGCGDVADGIGVRWEGTPPGLVDAESVQWRGVFVLSWEDFERAYLAIKAARAAEAPKQTFDCLRCGKKDVPGGTYGGYCIDCDVAVEQGAPDRPWASDPDATSQPGGTDRDG